MHVMICPSSPCTGSAIVAYRRNAVTAVVTEPGWAVLIVQTMMFDVWI